MLKGDYWITKDGRKIKLEDLSDSHLCNILRMWHNKAVKELKQILRNPFDLDLSEHEISLEELYPEGFDELLQMAGERKLDWRTYGKELPDPEMIDLNNRGSLERQLAGALRDCIEAHGPITKDKIGSATKRVVGAIKDHHKRKIKSIAENFS